MAKWNPFNRTAEQDESQKTDTEIAELEWEKRTKGDSADSLDVVINAATLQARTPREVKRKGEISLPTESPVDFGILTIEEQKRLNKRAEREVNQPRKARKRIKIDRVNQVKTRLTDEELILFQARVKAAGMKQGDYIRELLLHEKVEIKNVTGIDAIALDTLMTIATNLGRIGGLIRTTVIANKDNPNILTAADKQKLEMEIKELSALKVEIQKVVQTIYGNS